MNVVAGPVLYEVRDAVATITINQPERRNPLSARVLHKLRSALHAADDDAGARAVVLTGAGDRAFSAGADLAEWGDGGDELERHDQRGLFVEVFLQLERLGKPVVGAVNGHALAGGLGLALCCDLLIASETATFGTPEINVGLWPMMVMALVTRTVGRKRAMELFMTGERIDAARALEWGLVNRVVPAAAVREEAHALAHTLAGRSATALRHGREAFYTTDGMPFDAALRHLQAQLTLVSMSDDAREGVTAFLEKRPPRFRGH